jgi:phosphoglycolate phosphatase
MTNRPFDAVIFDLDGTLIDSVPDVGGALNIMLAARGRRPVTQDEVRLMVGEGAKVMLERVFAATGGPDPDPDGAMVAYLAAFSAHPVVDTLVYPGAEAALRRLSAAGVSLGLCTNKPSGVTRLVLDALGLSPLFAAIIGGDSLPYRKPDPRHVTGTLAAMGLADGARVAYVGDSETDVAAARGAGLPVVAVSFGYAKDAVTGLGADVLIDHFDELDVALERLAR